MYSSLKSILPALSLLLLTTGAAAQVSHSGGEAPADTLSTDTVIQREVFHIRALARPKGEEGVILRWAPEEYAPWFYLNRSGYTLLRITDDSLAYHVDTLVDRLRPMTLEQLQSHFQPSDSLAGAAAQLLWGSAQDEAQASSYSGIVEKYEQQSTRFAYAMLLSEIRPDIAEAMALRYVDRTAEPGRTYQYLVCSPIPDSIMNIRTVGVTVKNEPQAVAPFHPVITDSIGQNGNAIHLYWPMDDRFSTYDIFRQTPGQEGWTLLNAHPFLTLMTDEDGYYQNVYTDNDLLPGHYRYRIRAYDTFAEGTEYSSEHSVYLPDIIPPAPPAIRQFVIDRDSDPGKLWCDIKWHKDSIEADMVGFDVLYFHEREGKEWGKLNASLVASTDSMLRVEMTEEWAGGFIAVAAVDTAGNYGTSLPYELHIDDRTPPLPPTGLKATVSPMGTVFIQWEPSASTDVKNYQLFSANDTTHVFNPLPGRLTTECYAFDTLQVFGINQRYIYYRLQAYDYSGNSSELSQILRVKRKNFDKPEAARPDSIWTSNDSICIRWIGSHHRDVDYYNYYRRRSDETEWQMIGQILVDEDNEEERFMTYDRPGYDRQHQWQYCLEAFNTTGLGSGKSYRASILLQPDMYVDVPIVLDADTIGRPGIAAIRWQLQGTVPSLITSMLPPVEPVLDRRSGEYRDRVTGAKINPETGRPFVEPSAYSFLIQRDSGDGNFITRQTVGPEVLNYRESAPNGEVYRYRIVLRLRDGRYSNPSNVISLSPIPVPKQ